jgi:hypothetical protein
MMASMATQIKFENPLDGFDPIRRAGDQSHNIAFCLFDGFILFQNANHLTVRPNLLFTPIRHPAHGSEHLTIRRLMLLIVAIGSDTTRCTMPDGHI